eukprot:jgi/Bigna1/73061/fgenesh1_pg.22_\
MEGKLDLAGLLAESDDEDDQDKSLMYRAYTLVKAARILLHFDFFFRSTHEHTHQVFAIEFTVRYSHEGKTSLPHARYSSIRELTPSNILKCDDLGGHAAMNVDINKILNESDSDDDDVAPIGIGPSYVGPASKPPAIPRSTTAKGPTSPAPGPPSSSVSITADEPLSPTMAAPTLPPSNRKSLSGQKQAQAQAQAKKISGGIGTAPATNRDQGDDGDIENKDEEPRSSAPTRKPPTLAQARRRDSVYRPGKECFGGPGWGGALDLEILIGESRKLLQKERKSGGLLDKASLDELINSDSDDDMTGVGGEGGKSSSDDIPAGPLFQQMLRDILADSDDEDSTLDTPTVDAAGRISSGAGFEVRPSVMSPSASLLLVGGEEEKTLSVEEIMRQIEEGTPKSPHGSTKKRSTGDMLASSANVDDDAAAIAAYSSSSSKSAAAHGRGGGGGGATDTAYYPTRSRAGTSVSISSFEDSKGGRQARQLREEILGSGGHSSSSTSSSAVEGSSSTTAFALLLTREHRKRRSGNRRLFTPLKDRRATAGAGGRGGGGSSGGGGGATVSSGHSDRKHIAEQQQHHQIISMVQRAQIHHVLRRDREQVGIPTCCAVGPKLIIVGCSYGFILIFDRSYKLLQPPLGQPGQTKLLGKVVCVDIAPGGSIVAVGHSKGQIILWDLMKRTVLKAVPDIFSTRILSVRFTSSLSKTRAHRLVANDARGNVVGLSVSKGFFLNWNVGKTFELLKSNGFITAMEPLLLPTIPKPSSGAASSPTGRSSSNIMILTSLLSEIEVVAVCDESTLRIVASNNGGGGSIKAGRVLATFPHPRPPPRTATPAAQGCSLAWWSGDGGSSSSSSSRSSSNSSSSSSPPLLAMVRGRVLRVFEAVMIGNSNSSNSSISFRIAYEGLTPEGIISGLALGWVGGVLLVAGNSKGGRRALCVTAPSLSTPGTSPPSSLSSFPKKSTEIATLQAVVIPDLNLIYEQPTRNAPPSYANAVRGTTAAAIVKSSAAATTGGGAAATAGGGGDGGGLLMLGLDTAVEARARTWQERIELHTRRGKWIHALALALDFFEGTARAPVGLPHDAKQRRNAVLAKCQNLLLSYTDLALGQFLSAGNATALGVVSRDSTAATATAGHSSKRRGRLNTEEAPHFRVVGAVVVDFCLVIGRPALLFERIYKVFARADGEDVLLDLLEPFILNNRLRVLPKAVFKAFAEQMTRAGRSEALEQCILHLDTAEMDVNQLLAACEERGLWAALIHTNTHKKPKPDFAAPVRTLHLNIASPTTVAETSTRGKGVGASSTATTTPSFLDTKMMMMTTSKSSSSSSSSSSSTMPDPFLLMLYIKFCWTGRRYPGGEIIEVARQPLIKAQVLSVVFEAYPFRPLRTPDGRRHSASGESFPIAKQLLRQDAALFLEEVVDLLFEDTSWCTFCGSKAQRAARRRSRATGYNNNNNNSINNGSTSSAAKADFSPVLSSPSKRQTLGHSRSASTAGGVASTTTTTNHADDDDGVGGRDYVPSLQEIVDLLLSFLPLFATTTSAAAASEWVLANERFVQYHIYIFAAKHMAESRIKGDSKIMGEAIDMLLRPPPRRPPVSDNARGNEEHEEKEDEEKKKKESESSLSLYVQHQQQQEGDGGEDNQHGSSSETKRERDSRQRILLALLAKCPKELYDEQQLLDRATAANLHQVRVFMLRQRGDYALMVKGYLNDPTPNRRKVFSFIRGVLEGGEGGSEEVKLKMREAVLRQCDQSQAARLVIDFFAENPDIVITKLNDTPKLQFQILRQIMLHRGRKKEGGGDVPEDGANYEGDGVVEDDVRLSYDATSGGGDDTGALLEQSGLWLSDELHRIFIRLLCKFDAKAVYPHLTRHHDYDIDSILRLCQENNINDATAYLLERTGDMKGALALTFKQMAFLNVNKRRFDPRSLPEYKKIISTIKLGCSRCSNTVDNRVLWFSLLDKIISYKRDGSNPPTSPSPPSSSSSSSSSSPPTSSTLSFLMRVTIRKLLNYTLQAMYNDMPLGVILKQIFKKYPRNELADFRQPIREILDTSEHEMSVRETATRLQELDIITTMRAHVCELSRATSKYRIGSAASVATKAQSGEYREKMRKKRLRRLLADERRAANATASSSLSRANRRKGHQNAGKVSWSSSSSSAGLELNLTPLRNRGDGHRKKEFREGSKGILRKEVSLDKFLHSASSNRRGGGGGGRPLAQQLTLGTIAIIAL